MNPVPECIRILRQSRCLAFDLDGTLVDSNEIKWRAFEEVFKDYTDRLPEISRYCRSSNHTIRGQKFRHVCEEILGLPYTQAIDRSLHERYAGFTTQAVIDAPEIAGAECFLRRVAGRYETAVLSSTPHEILPIILEGRHWDELFHVRQGAPVNKAAWLGDFRHKRGLALHEMVFFGDTPEDMEAGEKAGCTFIGVNGGQAVCDESRYRIRDFRDLVYDDRPIQS